MYYFAYGTNMNHKEMTHRCPTAKFIKRAALKDYRFQYEENSQRNKGSAENIIESAGDVVWGGLWDIHNSDLERLDRFEGYDDKISERKDVIVIDNDGEGYDAIVYYKKVGKKKKPGLEYENSVIQGAKDCGLPDNYIFKYLKTKIWRI